MKWWALPADPFPPFSSAVPLHPGMIDHPFGVAHSDQAVEVGAAFTSGERKDDTVAHADVAAKQAFEDIDAATGFAQFVLQFNQQLLLRTDQVVDARVQAKKALIVRGQHQDFAADFVANTHHGRQPVAERVALRMVGRD